MALAQSSSRSLFSITPVEIRQAILSEISDIPTLDAALEADASLQSAFLGFESRILERILDNQFTCGLLFHAYAVQTVSKLESVDPERTRLEQVCETVRSYFYDPSPPSIEWSLDQVRPMSVLRCHIEFFVEDFISTALFSFGRWDGSEEPPSPASRSERARIADAFYYFELYCNLFREHATRRAESTLEFAERNDFFGRLEALQCERLRCVYFYLVDKISPAFDYMAKHDVEWGKHNIPSDDSGMPQWGYKDHILSHGLAYLHELVDANSYKEYRRLLGASPRAVWRFLYLALSRLQLPPFLTGPHPRHRIILAQDGTDDEIVAQYGPEIDAGEYLPSIGCREEVLAKWRSVILENWYVVDDEEGEADAEADEEEEEEEEQSVEEEQIEEEGRSDDESDGEYGDSLSDFYADGLQGLPRLMRGWVRETVCKTQELLIDEYKALRRRGYFMWDFARHRREWRVVCDSSRDIANTQLPWEKERRSREDIVRSYHRRMEIWDQGGRGWWSKDDESHIVWEPKHESAG